MPSWGNVRRSGPVAELEGRPRGTNDSVPVADDLDSIITLTFDQGCP